MTKEDQEFSGLLDEFAKTLNTIERWFMFETVERAFSSDTPDFARDAELVIEHLRRAQKRIGHLYPTPEAPEAFRNIKETNR